MVVKDGGGRTPDEAADMWTQRGAPFQISAEDALRALHVHHAGPVLLDALQDLVAIIKAAGVWQLSRGVELGPVSWSVKCNDRIEAAEKAIARATGEAQ